MQFLNSISFIKTELKVFFVIWLCLSFILSPMMFGLYLTPKIIAPQAHAIFGLLGGVVDAAKWVWEAIKWAYDKVQSWAVAAWTWGKDHLTDLLKKAFLIATQVVIHTLLTHLTNSIIKWIQSDFHGQPGFVTDWQQYLKQAGQAASGRFLNELAGVNLCAPFKINLRLSLGLPVPNFKTEAACTLDGILANMNTTISAFYKDFTKGGWIAFDEGLQPNNNAFGAYLMALDAKQALQFAEIQKAEKEAQSGFKSMKKCISTTRRESREANASTCDQYQKIANAGVGNPGSIAKTQEEYNTAVNAYQSQCTGATVDPSTVDPSSPDCTSSITTAPDGTVELSTNLAATSGIDSIKDSLSGITAKLGEYGPYVVAISNALINQLIKDGMNGLLGTTPQPERLPTSDVEYPTPDTEMIKAADKMSDDLAIIGKIRENLNQVSGGIIKNSIANYQKLLTLTQSVQGKQDSIINDLWAAGVWDNKTNDKADDDASASITDQKAITNFTDVCIKSTINASNIVDACTTTTAPATTTTYNETCMTPPPSTSDPNPKPNCSLSKISETPAAAPATIPQVINMTNFTRASTTTTTTYNVNHSKIGKTGLIETKTQIIDSRTADSLNTLSANYNGQATYVYALAPETLNQIEGVDGKVSEYQNKVTGLSNLTNLVPSIKTALDNFEKYGNIFTTEFQKDASSTATKDTYNKVKEARDTVISALQTIIGSSTTTLEELNNALEAIINGISVDSAKESVITTTEADGMQTTQSPSEYYKDYLNDVITIYNSLQSVKTIGYLSAAQ